ncbi:hypothetical protein [Fibrella forsythiae]|uniref:Uncharacterized protein n=1 Tax=Fibrella forsythiae TaxID=2817061 RepID=A0ABS3JSL3_9BACT|nr:hypothetical protein [Fibrella forsythiae]MBO0953002.1 hypothetical protein [Fibrella forsythiae]
MKRDWLLPHSFRLVGWLLLVPALLLGIVWVYFDAVGKSLADSLGGSLEGHQTLTYFLDYLDEIISVAAILGLLTIGFAREKVEDEMIQQVRLESLQWAIYVNYGCLLISTLCFYDVAFFRVMIYNMFTPLLVFVGRYLWALHKLRRADELNAQGGLLSL